MRTPDEIITRVIEVRKLALQDLLDRNSTDQYVIRSRHLCAYLLSVLWHDHDEGRVQQRLGCSPQMIETAHRLARGDAEFQVQLDAIRGIEDSVTSKDASDKQVHCGQIESKPVVESKTAAESPEQVLFRIAKERYGYDRDEIRKNFSNTHRVRRVIALIGKSAFFMSSRQIAVIFECVRPTVTNLLQVALYDYIYDETFATEVNDICKKHKLILDRTRLRLKHETADA